MNNNRLQRVYLRDNVITSLVRQRIASSPGNLNAANQHQYAKMGRRVPLVDMEPNLYSAETRYASNTNRNCLHVGAPRPRSYSASHFKVNPGYYENHKEIGFPVEAGPSHAQPKCNGVLRYATVRNAPPSESDLRSYNYGYDDADDDDDVFYVAENHFYKQLSPIKNNDRTAHDIVLMSPVVKKMIRKKIARKQTSIQEDFACVFGRLYNREYIQDNIYYLLSSENKHVIKESKFKEKHVDSNGRAMVIDWLIKVQDQLKMTRTTFFQTIRLFDSILTSTNVALNMYQLVAITCTWILNKFNNDRIASSRELMRLTGGAYTLSQLFNMEFRIFNYMGCKCNIVDPCAFLEYYIIWTGIKNKEVLLASYYMLELMTLSPYFSTLSPSSLAASSFYLALRTLREDITIIRRLQNCGVYYEFEETSLIQQRIWTILERVITKKIPFQACYIKYSTIDYNFISLVITKAVTATKK